MLAGFADSLERDYRKTLNQFLAIQAMGSERARDEIRVLRERLFDHGEPVLAALRGALSILQTADLRSSLPDIHHEALLVAGERDTLMPKAAAEKSVALMPHAQLALIEGAGHAPFISHPEPFLKSIRQFIHE